MNLEFLFYIYLSLSFCVTFLNQFKHVYVKYINIFLHVLHLRARKLQRNMHFRVGSRRQYARQFRVEYGTKINKEQSQHCNTRRRRKMREMTSVFCYSGETKFFLIDYFFSKTDYFIRDEKYVNSLAAQQSDVLHLHFIRSYTYKHL